jgi:glutaminyl-tRNA synthetase
VIEIPYFIYTRVPKRYIDEEIMTNSEASGSQSTDFIRSIINEDLHTGKHGGKVVTRFPPEPNGYLHIGHAKSICLNFGLASEYRGTCHLRFDDTDPIKEEVEFEHSIIDAVRWLGFDYGEHLYHASDYFDKLYDLAVKLIKQEKAYVCSLNLEEIREYRGTVTEAGRNSPYRDRSVEENVNLFKRMKAGEFKDGEHVLRAKIDMASANMKMRDPLLYRIRHATHHMTGDKWCIYPLYDFTHCLSDSIEGITHSICTLEFENNRELYDWVIDTLNMPDKPKQYEFARLNINYTVMSKRKIQMLVNGGHVSGWDDPRLLTIAGLRRRGYTAEAIRNFCASVGIAKANSVVDMAQLEFSIRNDLNFKSPRVLAVLDPLKIVITNFPEEKIEEIEAPYYPEDVPKEGSRMVPFTREVYIERSDFMEIPTKGYFRLSPGGEVRLRYGYIIKCHEVVKNDQGDVVELRCTYDEETPLGENPSDGRRVKGTIHWVSVSEALPVEVRVYDRLFTVENPGALDEEDLPSTINKNSLVVHNNAFVEPSVRGAATEEHFQFERLGFFVTDLKNSSEEKLVFNQTVALKDSWGKQKKMQKPKVAEHKKVEKKQQQPSERRPEVELTTEQKILSDRYQQEFQLPQDHAQFLATDRFLSSYFDEAVQVHLSPKLIANWIINELQRELKECEGQEAPISAIHLAELVKAIDEEVISSKIAKDVYADMLQTGNSPTAIIESKGLKQITDVDELSGIIDRLVADHPDVVEQIRGGRTNRMSFFVGQVMKATKGKASPQIVNQLLSQKLL